MANAILLGQKVTKDIARRLADICVLFISLHCASCGPGSVVGIATGYGLDGPGIKSRGGARFSAPVQTGPGAPQPPVQWVPGLSRG
jgi:hypothetical protein